MTVEAAHHTTAIASREINPTFSSPQEYQLFQFQEKKSAVEYEYPLQQRISTEWANLLGNNFTVETNVAVFRDKVEQLEALIKDPNARREDVLRKLAYIKIGAISIATAKGKDIHEYVDKKLDLMQKKYNPDAVTQLRLSGCSTKEACRKLKINHENGEVFEYQEFEIPPEEEEARKPRIPAFRDAYQDMSDTWMRRSYGADLENHDSMEVVVNEAHELLAEFYDDEGNQLSFEMDDEKLELVMGEIADVVISGDGKFSDEGECVEEWQNFALDRMIDTYGDVPKLRRMGVATQVAMHYLSECRYRDDNGFPRPIDRQIPGNYSGPVFRIQSKVPLEPNFSSEAIH